MLLSAWPNAGIACKRDDDPNGVCHPLDHPSDGTDYQHAQAAKTSEDSENSESPTDRKFRDKKLWARNSSSLLRTRWQSLFDAEPLFDFRVVLLTGILEGLFGVRVVRGVLEN